MLAKCRRAKLLDDELVFLESISNQETMATRAEDDDGGGVVDGAAAKLMKRNQEGLDLLNTFSASLKRLAEANQFLGEEEEKLLKYINKLESAQGSMVNVMNRCQAMQLNLNTIRLVYSSHSKALVQQGPFRYKCVYQGGVRYRDYPKEDAAILKTTIEVGETVQVDERVYIAGEALVYLHVKGKGWLFENKNGIIALKRVYQ